MKNTFLFLGLLVGAIFLNNCAGEGSSTEQAIESTTEAAPEAANAAPELDNAPVSNTVLNPNLATAEDLSALPMISEELASKIVENRPFLTAMALKEAVAADLDDATIAAMLKVCFVPMNLNTTAEADFKLVPGVGDKMAHEFEEYRPYKKIAQFRREMAKYVDDDEIARYEKYVFVPVALNSATDEEILAIPGVGDRMLHEFKEYRPYKNIEQFRREMAKYVDENELARLERFVYVD